MVRRKRGYKRMVDKKRDYRLFAIACEGSVRERDYFECFEVLSTRISVDLISDIDVGSSVPSISYKGYSVISASRIFTGFEWFKNASTGYEDVQAAAVAGGMTYDDTLGHYVYKTTVAAEYLNATYGYKVIQDATDSGVNRAFYLPAVDNSVDSISIFVAIA